MGLQEIVENYGAFPEYVTQDFLFKIACEESEYINDYIEAIPSLRPLFWELVDTDQAMSLESFDRIITASPLYKLNWRSAGNMYDETGKETIFNHLTQWSKKFTL